MRSAPIEGKARDTVINWHAILRGVIDGYEQQTSITHGVQKDAIQNGWDARKTKKGTRWSFTFELVQGNGHSYFCMTDTGTTGLTGDVLDADEYLEGLPPEEKWAAFEGYGFTKEDIEQKRSLGSRGRGKFIFVAASKTNEINYDTMTESGNYRLGGRKIELTGSPVKHYDGDKGREIIQRTTGGAIKPLDQVGMRIIIIDPIDELVDAIKSREFDFMIAETWWEIIKKYDAKIVIKAQGEERRVSIPYQFLIPDKSIDTKRIWLKRGLKLNLGGVTSSLRTLHIVCQPGEELPEELRGISIQRGGMKICTIEPVALPDNIRESIYGYVTFDEVGETAIKESEGVEHNSISFKRGFAKDLRRWLQTQMMEFATKELGYKSHPERERREKQRAAERRALSAINKIASQFEFKRKGPSAREIKRSVRGFQKPIRIILTQPIFPNPLSSRVDYKQSIDGISAMIQNDTCEDVRVKLRVFVRYGDELIVDMDDSEHNIKGNQKQTSFGPKSIRILKSTFRKKGMYILTVRITNAETAERIDQKGFSFYVETEPMARGIFEDFRPFGLDDDEYRFSIGYTEPSSSGGLILNYNVQHPSYLTVEDDDDAATEHLFRFAAMELATYDLSSDHPRIVEFNQSDANDIEYVLERYALAIGKLFYYFHKGLS